MLGADAGLASADRDELAALLGRWRGPAFPELEDADEGRVEAVRP
ncbi:MAG: hypothetical protein ACRD0K_24570 [Egibacteraceae bacterium]